MIQPHQQQELEDLSTAILSSTTENKLINSVHQLCCWVDNSSSKDVQHFQSRFEGLLSDTVLCFLTQRLDESEDESLQFEIARFFALLSIDTSPLIFSTVPDKLYTVLIRSLSSILDDSATEKTLDLIFGAIQQSQVNPFFLEKIQRFHREDIIGVILQRVKDFPNPLKAKACRLIGQLYVPYETYHFHPPLFSGALSFVVECFNGSDDLLVAAAIEALNSFTSDLEPESEWVLDIDSNLPERLIQLLQGSTEGMVLNALMTVTNITASGSPLTDDLLEEGLIPILAVILHSTNKKIVSEVCFSIATLTSESETCCQALVEASLVPHLLPLLSSTEDVQVQFKAICAVFGLLSEGSDSHREYLIEIGAVRAIFEAWQTIDLQTNDLSLIRPLYASLAYLVEFASSGDGERRERVTGMLRGEQRDIVTRLEALRLRGVFDREDKEVLATVLRFFQAA